MIKAEVKVDGRAWIPKSIFSQKAIKKLRKSLQIRLKPSPYDDGPTIVDMLEETDFHVGLPRGYFDRTSKGKLKIRYEISDERRNLVPAIFARDGLQAEGVKTLSDKLREEPAAGAIMCAATGVGKTVMGLLIAAELGYTTLVVVHTKVLMDQWIERINTKPGVFPDANVGIFQGDREEFGDEYDIVIAMVHSLANRPADHPIFSWPGLLMVDECHRMGAPTWNSVAHRFNAAKRLGLTATPRRRDGGERLFFETIGQIAWTASIPMMIPKVRKMITSFEFVDSGIPKFLEDKKLSEDMIRNQHIVKEVALARKSGRHILILTKLVSHVLILKKLIESQVSGVSIGVCVGGWYADEDDAADYTRLGKKKYQNRFTSAGKYDFRKIDSSIHKISWKKLKGAKKEYLAEIESNLADIETKISSINEAQVSLPHTQLEIDILRRRAKILRKCLTHTIGSIEPKRKSMTTEEFSDSTDQEIIIATYQMVSEGFDVPHLDTLFLVMPVSDPVQSTGRILRLHPDKKEPIVTHFIDDKVPKYRRAWQSCRRHYQDLGADV